MWINTLVIKVQELFTGTGSSDLPDILLFIDTGLDITIWLADDIRFHLKEHIVIQGRK